MSDSIQGFNAELKLNFDGVTNAISALKDLNAQIQLAKSGMKGSWSPGGGSRGPAIQQDNSFRDAMKELKNSVGLDKLVATTNAKADAVAKKEEARQAQGLGTSFKWLSGIALTVGSGLLKLLDVGAKEAHQTVMGAAQLGMDPSQFLRWKQMGKNLIGDENAGPGALAAMNEFTQSVKLSGNLDQQKAILMSTGLGDRLSKGFLDKNPEQQVLELMDAAQAKIKANPNDTNGVYASLNKILGGPGIGKIISMLNKFQGGESGAAYLKGETGVSNRDLSALTVFDINKNTTFLDFDNAIKPFEAALSKHLTKPMLEFDRWTKTQNFKDDLKVFSDGMGGLLDFLAWIPKLIFHAWEILLKDPASIVKTIFSGGDVGRATGNWLNDMGMGMGADNHHATRSSIDLLTFKAESEMDQKATDAMLPVAPSEIIRRLNPDTGVDLKVQLQDIFEAMEGRLYSNFKMTIAVDKNNNPSSVSLTRNGTVIATTSLLSAGSSK